VELVQTIVNAMAIGVVGLVLARMTQGLRHETREEIRELRSELKGEIAELRAEMRDIRSDLTRVGLAVGAEPRTGRQ